MSTWKWNTYELYHLNSRGFKQINGSILLLGRKRNFEEQLNKISLIFVAFFQNDVSRPGCLYLRIKWSVMFSSYLTLFSQGLKEVVLLKAAKLNWKF